MGGQGFGAGSGGREPRNGLVRGRDRKPRNKAGNERKGTKAKSPDRELGNGGRRIGAECPEREPGMRTEPRNGCREQEPEPRNGVRKWGWEAGGLERDAGNGQERKSRAGC